MSESKNYFKDLYALDFADKVKQKNGLNYLSWAAAWAAVKERYPEANYTVFENENGRFWFDDGKTGWVKVGVQINGITHTERLAVMDHRNQSYPADKIDSTKAVVSMQRALTKACGRHGVGLYLYEGEDIPEETKKKQESLKEHKSKLTSLSKTLIDTYGVPRDHVIGVIADKNDGNKNPNSITDEEICLEIISIFEDEIASKKREEPQESKKQKKQAAGKE